MENKFNQAREIALLNLYAGYLLDVGLVATVLPSESPKSLDLLQVKLVDNGYLNLLFVPLDEATFRTLAVIQFHYQFELPKLNELNLLKKINQLNQEIPIGKLCLKEDNIFEYSYYMTSPLHVPLNKEEFVERFSLVLSQLEVVFASMSIPKTI